MVGNLTLKNTKCQMPGGHGRGGGARAPLDLTHTLGVIIPKPSENNLEFKVAYLLLMFCAC